MSFKWTLRATTAVSLITASTAFANGHSETITIATVNNRDMIRMQGYTDEVTAETGIAVEWFTLEENVLCQHVTTDITTNGGQFDIMTIGMYETPIWGANGWLVPLDDPDQLQDPGAGHRQPTDHHRWPVIGVVVAVPAA